MEKNVIKNSTTYSEAIIKIFGYDNGKSRKKFNELVIKQKFNISHLIKRKLKYPIIEKTCPVCGEKFKTQLGKKGEKTTCSYSCSNTYFRSGKSNGNWNEDSYRSTCFEHHKKECIICGENKIVTVHHYDENKKNNKPENLIPLCPTHHQYVHSGFKNEVMDKINSYREDFIKKR